MEWANNSSEVVVQRLNRLQNTNEFLIADAGTGAVRTVLVEQDSTWVETVDDLTWLDGGKRFPWASERDGWNHVYPVSRDGSDVRLLTPGAFDVARRVVGGHQGRLALLHRLAGQSGAAVPLPRPARRHRPAGRLTPAGQAGVHALQHVAQRRLRAPHLVVVRAAPDHRPGARCPIAPVAARRWWRTPSSRRRVAALRTGPAEFFSVDIGGGVSLNGWIMKPAGVRPEPEVPGALLRVRRAGIPDGASTAGAGAPTSGTRMLTQQGYLVASVDNRGTGARGPRLPQGHLRPDGRHRDPGPGGGRAGHRAAGATWTPPGSASGAGATAGS